MAYGTTLQRLVYYYSPGVVKDAMASVFGIRQRKERYGASYREWLSFLRGSERWSNEQLLAYRDEQTDTFLRTALATVPYYRRIEAYSGWKPGDGLGALPILTKAAVRDHLSELYAPDAAALDPRWVQTSGTTGKALRFPLSRSCFQREYAFRALHYSWAGVSLDGRDRIAICAGHPVADPERQQPPYWARDLANNWIFFSSYHLTARNLPAYIATLEDFQPLLLGGYPSSVYLLALAYRASGKGRLRLRGVFTGSETILGHQREAIEGSFATKLYNWYGNSEMCAHIVECEQGELHLKLEHSMVEVLDDQDRPCAPGQPGRLICTSFGNAAFPLIRYDVGDRVTLSARQTSRCGRGGVLVDAIDGRTEDYVVTPDGRLVGRLDHLFKDARNVVEAQLYQDRPEELVVKVVTTAAYTAADEAAILEEARRRLGSAIAVRFEHVEAIPRAANGKFRFIISLVNQRQAVASLLTRG